MATSLQATSIRAPLAARRHDARASPRLLLPAAVLLPLAILCVGAAITWRGVWDQARAEVVHSADAAAEYARNVLDLHRMRAERVNQLLQGLSDAAIREREAELHVALRSMLGIEAAGGPIRVFVFDREGRPLLSSDFLPAPSGVFTDRAYFRAAVAPGAPGVIIGEVELGRANGLNFFPVTLRRSATGNGLAMGSFDGLINVSVSPEAIAQGLKTLRGQESDTASLVRADGAVLARTLPLATSPPWRQMGGAAVLQFMQTGAPRFERLGTSPLDGVSRLVAYRQVEGWPVYAAVARDTATIHAAGLARLFWLVAVGLPAMACLIVLAILARRAHAGAEQARAELETRVDARTAQLADRTTELATSEERLRLALEATDLGIWEADLRTDIITRSARTTEILGLSPDERMATVTAWRDRLHPDDLPTVTAAFDALRQDETTRYLQEYRLQRPDGSWVWVESCARAVERDAAGMPVRVAGTLRDVTARRDAEQRRALLAREVDHRAKNALAVVQAALRLTPRDDPRGYATAVEGRVAALARAHNLLAAQRWSGADLHQILQGELAAFLPREGGGGQPRAELTGPPIRVAASAAQSLSLAFHELATNAMKYGALATRGGSLRVAWQTDPQAGVLRLSWRETGGPAIPGTPGRHGFGSRVIVATVREQLGGQVQQNWLPGGLEVEITVPMARLLADTQPPATLEPVA